MLRLLAFAVLTILPLAAATTRPKAAATKPASKSKSSPLAKPKTTPDGSSTSTPTAPAPAAPRFVFSRCNVDGPYIAITFDDGPDPVQTPRLLKMLRDRNLKATFFLLGQCVAQSPEVAQMIVKEGHEVANHSWSHPILAKMSMDSVRDQLSRTDVVIRQETDTVPTLMRPPYGSFTTQQRAWTHATWGYDIILWDVDSLDWKHRNPAKTESIIMAETKPGSIILCHDIHKTTVDAMPAVLDHLLAKGFKFVTVSELIKMHHEKGTPAPAVAVRAATPAEGAAAATSLEDIAKRPVIVAPAAPATPAVPAPGAPAPAATSTIKP